MEFFHLPWDIFSCDIIQADTGIACLAPRKLVLHQHSQEWDFSFQRCSMWPSFRGWLLSILPASAQKSSFSMFLCYYFIFIFLGPTYQRETKVEGFILAHGLRGFSSSWWSEIDEQFVSYHDRPRNKKKRMLLLWWHYTFLPTIFFLLFFSSPQVVQPVFRFFLLFLFFGNVFTKISEWKMLYNQSKLKTIRTRYTQDCSIAHSLWLIPSLSVKWRTIVISRNGTHSQSCKSTTI